MSENQKPLKVLITGAHGLIGNLTYARLAENPQAYEPYGMVRSLQPRHNKLGENFCEIPPERLRLADLTDFEAIQKAVEGMDMVVHMAADAGGRSWESVLSNNIIGTYNIFEASRLAGVKRVIFASTNHTVFGYRYEEPYKALFEGRFEDVPEDYQPIRHDMPPKTMNIYGSSKVWGEMMAHTYAQVHNMSMICLRIGWVLPDDRPPFGNPYLNARILWCSQRDILQLIVRCLDAPESLRFDIFHGQSNNRYNLVDITHPMEVLGYQPQDSVEDYLN